MIRHTCAYIAGLRATTLPACIHCLLVMSDMSVHKKRSRSGSHASSISIGKLAFCAARFNIETSEPQSSTLPSARFAMCFKASGVEIRNSLNFCTSYSCCCTSWEWLSHPHIHLVILVRPLLPACLEGLGRKSLIGIFLIILILTSLPPQVNPFCFLEQVHLLLLETKEILQSFLHC